MRDIIVSIFGDLNEDENKFIESTIQHIIDNKLVKKNTLFFKRFRFIEKSSYDIFKVSIRIIDYTIKILFNERFQSIIPLLQHLPSHYIGISSVAELVVCGMSEIGLSYKVIAIILLFL